MAGKVDGGCMYVCVGVRFWNLTGWSENNSLRNHRN